NGILAVYL
ncbi:unnamed protein product, partial [Fusarium fujikuroi]